jgi:hypothetical protein
MDTGSLVRRQVSIMVQQDFPTFSEEASGKFLAAMRKQLAMIFSGGLILLVVCGSAFRTFTLLWEAPGKGSVDMVVIESEAKRVTISGWVGAFYPGVALTSISVYLGDEEIYSGAADQWDRPDAVSSGARPEQLNSGWRIAAAIPETMHKGRYPLKVRAQLEDGEEFELTNGLAAKDIEIP